MLSKTNSEFHIFVVNGIEIQTLFAGIFENLLFSRCTKNLKKLMCTEYKNFKLVHYLGSVVLQRTHFHKLNNYLWYD